MAAAQHCPQPFGALHQQGPKQRSRQGQLHLIGDRIIQARFRQVSETLPRNMTQVFSERCPSQFPWERTKLRTSGAHTGSTNCAAAQDIQLAIPIGLSAEVGVLGRASVLSSSRCPLEGQQVYHRADREAQAHCQAEARVPSQLRFEVLSREKHLIDFIVLLYFSALSTSWK